MLIFSFLIILLPLFCAANVTFPLSKAKEKTHHHLSSEELGDGSLNTSAFHFVFHIVQKLKQTTMNSTQVIIWDACIYKSILFKRL